MSRAKGPYFGARFFIFLLIMMAGNTVTTLAAAAIVRPFTADANVEPQNRPTTNPAPPPLLSAGPPWLWYAFIGVFAFEAILQQINVTIFDRNVLTINDWITKARDLAVQGAIKSVASAQIRKSAMWHTNSTPSTTTNNSMCTCFNGLEMGKSPNLRQ